MGTPLIQKNKIEKPPVQVLYIDGKSDLIPVEYFKKTELRQFFNNYVLEHVNLKHSFLNFNSRIEKDLLDCKYDMIIVSPFITKKEFKPYLKFLKRGGKFVQVGIHTKKIKKYKLNFEKEYNGTNPFTFYTKFK